MSFKRTGGMVALLLLALGACTSSEKPEPTGKAAGVTGERESAPPAAARKPGSGEVGMVPASELEYVESKVTVDKAEGDAKKDAWNYFTLWGEVRNKSSKWVVAIAGDIRYFDAKGKELGINSISTEVKKDVGDTSPGERVRGDTQYIAPGASVPLHHIRSLNKIGGAYASYKITLRPARVAAAHPEVALTGLTDSVGNVVNESLAGASPMDHRVVGGTLKNSGNLGCRDPGLIVGFYDAQGKLTDLKEGDAGGVKELAPGSSAPVKVFTLVGFDNAWKAKATIKTWARCSEPY